jgi:hypothetical protein
MMKFSCSVLSGLQLSGLLNCKIGTSIDSAVAINAWCPNMQGLSGHASGLVIKAPPISLKATADQFLRFGLDTMTYASAIAWVIAHTIAPSIQRPLLIKEEKLIRQVIEAQNIGIDSNDALQSNPAKPRTLAGNISYLIEYLMPVLFKGCQVALGTRFIRHVGDSLDFQVGSNPYDILLGNASFGIKETANVVGGHFILMGGEDPISDAHLWMLMGLGIALYFTQAICNFQDELETKNAEGSPDSATIEEVTEEEASFC